MGLKCRLCGTDNGITQYFGKKCRRCGEVLMSQEDWECALSKEKDANCVEREE